MSNFSWLTDCNRLSQQVISIWAGFSWIRWVQSGGNKTPSMSAGTKDSSPAKQWEVNSSPSCSILPGPKHTSAESRANAEMLNRDCIRMHFECIELIAQRPHQLIVRYSFAYWSPRNITLHLTPKWSVRVNTEANYAKPALKHCWSLAMPCYGYNMATVEVCGQVDDPWWSWCLRPSSIWFCKTAKLFFAFDGLPLQMSRSVSCESRESWKHHIPEIQFDMQRQSMSTTFWEAGQ